jgi:uncharacterized membrane protein HdeD (DUF308 family)
METLHTLDINWLAIGTFSVIQAILLMVCDTDHLVPRWSLRLFLCAVALQTLGIILRVEPILTAAQFVSTMGIAWVVFGLIQDIHMHRRKHQH